MSDTDLRPETEADTTVGAPTGIPPVEPEATSPASSADSNI